MGSVVGSATRLIDNDGDPLDDGAGKLNVTTTGNVGINGHAVVTSGSIEVSDSAGALATIICKHVDVMANLSNDGIVYIGGSALTAATGIALYPGDVYSVDVECLDLLYAMSTEDGDYISVQVLT